MSSEDESEIQAFDQGVRYAAVEFPLALNRPAQPNSYSERSRPEKESKVVDFKERLELSHAAEWCEIIKDIVAMANSGGGSIFVGVHNNGTPSGWDTSAVLSTDHADFVNKIAKYTGEQFADFEVVASQDGIAEIRVRAAATPIVFVKPGSYEPIPGKTKTAFQQGTIYFRHGAKSEPGNSQDLREFIEDRVEHVRQNWLGNIRKIVEAPSGSRIEVLAPADRGRNIEGQVAVRLVEDSEAPAYGKLNPDKTHPYRQKEVTEQVAKRLQKKIISFDILCIRKVYGIDESKPLYYHKSKFTSPQYSELFVEWIITEFKKNPQLFEEARAACKTVKAQDA